MATETNEDLSVAKAALRQFTREPVASASAPPSSPPASGSSGSSGTGSGSSGANNGSGGPPSGGSIGSSDNHDSGKNMDDEKSKKMLLRIMVGASVVLCCVACVLYVFAARSALFMTTPEGVAQTDRMLAYSNEMDARRHKEEMKDKENQGLRINERILARGATPPSSTAPYPQATVVSPSSGANCTALDGVVTTRRQPTKLGANACVSYGASAEGHWLFLESSVTRLRGIIKFSELNIVPRDDDKMQVLGEKDWCQTDQTTDNCLTWLSKHVGNSTLWFTSRGPVEISTR
jgi:hypothetical protein